MDSAIPEDAGQAWVVNIVKTSIEVQKEGGHLQGRPRLGFYVVHEGKCNRFIPG